MREKSSEIPAWAKAMCATSVRIEVTYGLALWVYEWSSFEK
jgi:hypothetical protein